ncbi:hypothetical protein BCR42DRAFT_422790 [Absidia repens]|uniref:Uncharacterized protein n=1 Tax=Absidia repens TaxID=90262 RepID=A0A1X2I5Y0_9FUNG|nr:hypothetical protein BCR42DRAFT_422790 [Absidia repens]
MAMNRPEYRDAKTPRAVTVYTVAQESRHVVFRNVPALSGEETIIQDLLNRCGLYGTVETWRQLDKHHQQQQQQQEQSQQSIESFTLSPLLVTFTTIDEARWVKRKMDDQVFYANLLQVSYAPEYDTVNDIRLKLENRRTRKKSRRTNRRWQPQRRGEHDDDNNNYVHARSAASIYNNRSSSVVIQGSKGEDNELLKTTGNTTTTAPSIDGIIPHALDQKKNNAPVATPSIIPASSAPPGLATAPTPIPAIKKRRRI